MPTIPTDIAKLLAYVRQSQVNVHYNNDKFAPFLEHLISGRPITDAGRNSLTRTVEIPA